MGHQQRPHLDLPGLRAGASAGVRFSEGGGICRDVPLALRETGRWSVLTAFPHRSLGTIIIEVIKERVW